MENTFAVPEQEPDMFPDEIQDDVDGLTWLGHLEISVEYCGHTFVLRTLKADEELEAAAITKDYMDTMGQAKAWAWANIALSLVSVDGEKDFCPPAGPNKQAYARSRFNWVTSRWYWHIGNYLFGQYLDLAQRQLRAIDSVRDLSARNQEILDYLPRD
jgi:hypothetical protein